MYIYEIEYPAQESDREENYSERRTPTKKVHHINIDENGSPLYPEIPVPPKKRSKFPSKDPDKKLLHAGLASKDCIPARHEAFLERMKKTLILHEDFKAELEQNEKKFMRLMEKGSSSVEECFWFFPLINSNLPLVIAPRAIVEWKKRNGTAAIPDHSYLEEMGIGVEMILVKILPFLPEEVWEVVREFLIQAGFYVTLPIETLYSTWKRMLEEPFRRSIIEIQLKLLEESWTCPKNLAKSMKMDKKLQKRKEIAQKIRKNTRIYPGDHTGKLGRFYPIFAGKYREGVRRLRAEGTNIFTDISKTKLEQLNDGGYYEEDALIVKQAIDELNEKMLERLTIDEGIHGDKEDSDEDSNDLLLPTANATDDQMQDESFDSDCDKKRSDRPITPPKCTYNWTVLNLRSTNDNWPLMASVNILRAFSFLFLPSLEFTTTKVSAELKKLLKKSDDLDEPPGIVDFLEIALAEEIEEDVDGWSEVEIIFRWLFSFLPDSIHPRFECEITHSFECKQCFTFDEEKLEGPIIAVNQTNVSSLDEFVNGRNHMLKTCRSCELEENVPVARYFRVGACTNYIVLALPDVVIESILTKPKVFIQNELYTLRCMMTTRLETGKTVAYRNTSEGWIEHRSYGDRVLDGNAKLAEPISMIFLERNITKTIFIRRAIVEQRLDSDDDSEDDSEEEPCMIICESDAD